MSGPRACKSLLAMPAVVARPLLATIADAGFVVGLGRDGEAVVVTATDSAGERHIVRGATAYVALCELAVQLGFDLEDG
ncbi:MAG: hypothetical protein ACYSUQ_05790 [Planctomycetota bacterium]